MIKEKQIPLHWQKALKALDRAIEIDYASEKIKEKKIKIENIKTTKDVFTFSLDNSLIQLFQYALIIFERKRQSHWMFPKTKNEQTNDEYYAECNIKTEEKIKEIYQWCDDYNNMIWEHSDNADKVYKEFMLKGGELFKNNFHNLWR